MTNYPIRRDVPAPLPGHIKYPFKDMEVGDSFLVPEELVGKITRAARAWTERHSVAIVVRKDSDGLWGCWRVK